MGEKILNLRLLWTFWRLSRLSAKHRKILNRISQVNDRIDGLRLRAASAKYRRERKDA